MRNNKRKGFTLVELLVVIAILAILATVSVVGYTSFIKSAYISNDENIAAQLNQFMVALKADSDGDFYDELQASGGKVTVDNVREITDYILNNSGLATLIPQAADYGYHFYFDLEKQEYVLIGDDDPRILGMSPLGRLLAGAVDYSQTAYPESCFTKDGRYFLVETGTKLADIVASINNATDLKGIQDLYTNVDAYRTNQGEQLKALVDFVKNSVFVTKDGTFVYDLTTEHKHLFIFPGATQIGNTKVSFIDTTKTESIDATNPLITVDKDITITVPAGVTPLANSMIIGGGKNVTIVFDAEDWGVDENKVSKLADANFTTSNAIVTLNDGKSYTVVGNKVYLKDAEQIDANVVAILGQSSPLDSFTIVENSDYAQTINGIIYITYDQGKANGLNLSVTTDVTDASSYDVTWSDESEYISVVDGKVTFDKVPPATLDQTTTPITVSATPVAGGEEYEQTVQIYVIAIKSATVTHGIGTLDMTADINENLTITYDGTNSEFSYDSVATNYNITTFPNELTECDKTVTITAGDVLDTNGVVIENADPIFKVENNKLTLLKYEGVQQITVTVGPATNPHLAKTFTITVVDNSDTPFVKTFTNEYLYRVGNSNEIKLGSLFTCEKPASDYNLKIYDASLTNDGQYVEVNGTNGFSATYTATATNWFDRTIKFVGTGVAIIDIDGVQLTVEVVNGKNVTSYSELSSSTNNILLQDITMTSGGSFSLSGNAINHVILYGNGFTFDVSAAKTTGFAAIQLSNADLDNIKVVGQLYTTYQSTYNSGNNEWYAATVYVTGDSIISNSYIYGCRSNIRVRGNLTLENTVLDTARFANMDIQSGNIVLKDVTTINEPQENNKYDENKYAFGFGIVIASECKSATLNVQGALTQYNWLRESDESYVSDLPGVSSIFDAFFSSENEQFKHQYNSVEYINTGIISMSADINGDHITFASPYVGKTTSITVALINANGYVASVSNEKYTLGENDLKYRNEAYGWSATAQGITPPVFNWSNYSSGSTEISFDSGETYNFDPRVLTATKNGNALSVTITMNGTTYSETIPFTTAGTYTITYTIEDPFNYDKNGTQLTTSVIYTRTLVVKVSVIEKTIKAPEFTFTDRGGNTYTAKTVTIGNKTYIMPDITSVDNVNTGKVSISGTTYYMVIVNAHSETTYESTFYRYFPLFSGVSIKNYTDVNDTNTTIASSTITSNTLFSSCGVVVPEATKSTGYGKIDDLTQAKGVAGNSGWDGTDYNSSYGGMYLKTSGVSSDTASNMTEGYVWIEYSFTAGNGQTYYYRIGYYGETGKDYSVCVTPETLITLADGTQKEIQYVTYDDTLLVWNHFTGEYDTVPAAIIFNHGYGYNTVIKLNFSDGTQVNVINLHQFFDADLNMYVSINEESVKDYVGHHFVKQNGSSYTTVTLESYEVSEEYVEAYGIISALHYNILVEGMLSTDFMPEDYDLFNYFAFGEGVKFDTEQMQSDIEQYGLYTYDDFADYLTYEQFVGFNVQYFKIAVGKGYYTYEGILDLIAEYLGE